ncbi:DUF2332 domain-containing protein [Rossellomorea aquimaris]|uniref:DUF2332 domain-containing protein n=1 Tax=Rossellomorea aquimaris TaxID=189382 RepID=UPI001CD26DFA|nr:DUF2332 domain-containing protein [Rossellomorea aquimaris]MCA1053800.1 DUF2332 domain-containing protein [Rossellomorea aquimaris]
MSLDNLSRKFNAFAELECHLSSPLYEFLSYQIAKDDELLGICNHCREGQPIPNLLFGSVHFLLMEDSTHPLRDYYSSIVNEPLPIKDSFPPFKDFCLQNEKQLIQLLQTKLVQTNEVRRCAYLYPAFCYMYEQVKKPLALIEIGTSAGVQLAWDHYQYRYHQNDATVGDSSSGVIIDSMIKGGAAPPLHSVPPPVSTRIGFDLHINNEEDFPWLLALIWPEHHERRNLFVSAANYIKSMALDLIEGDGVELLPIKAEEIPSEHTICVFHTHVANQLPQAAKENLQKTIKELGRKRDVFHLYNNMWDRKLHLDSYLNGEEVKRTIGETEGHGKWFEWNIHS